MSKDSRVSRARGADLLAPDHLPECAYCAELNAPGSSRCATCGRELLVELDVEALTRARTIPPRRRP